jgi:hypothetical protein
MPNERFGEIPSLRLFFNSHMIYQHDTQRHIPRNETDYQLQFASVVAAIGFGPQSSAELGW